jgi:SAM-dependent methyltransferase
MVQTLGCGDGRYLYQFAQRDLERDRIIGIDLSSPAIPRLKREGFRILSKRVEDCDEIEPNSIDLITMFHVIEHVEDPISVIRRLSGWLAPGGVLALETPNVESLDRYLFSEAWWGGYHIPRHWTLFTESNLQLALRKVGLTEVAPESFAEVQSLVPNAKAGPTFRSYAVVDSAGILHRVRYCPANDWHAHFGHAVGVKKVSMGIPPERRLPGDGFAKAHAFPNSRSFPGFSKAPFPLFGNNRRWAGRDRAPRSQRRSAWSMV